MKPPLVVVAVLFGAAPLSAQPGPILPPVASVAPSALPAASGSAPDAATEIGPPPAPLSAEPIEPPRRAPEAPASATPPASPDAGAGGVARAAHSAPAPSASAGGPRGAVVRLGEESVFELQLGARGQSREERARAASRALSSVVDDPEARDTRVAHEGSAAVVYVGKVAIVRLYEEDARLSREGALDAHAESVASAVRRALDSERKRSRIANKVFSVSLVVFFALIAFYLTRKVGQLADRLQRFVNEHGERLLAIRVRRIEIVHPAMLKSAVVIGVVLARWVAQFGILYAWLVIALSLFESTRGHTQRLTGLVLTPLSELLSRLATALPLLVVAGIAGLAVFLLVRFVGLFFDAVSRRETTLGWLPPDLAAPTSVLVRIGVVVAALIFATPIVIGEAGGPLTHAGEIALAAVGLAGAPLLASALIGSVMLFGRRLRVGDHVEIGGELGRVTAIDLLELHLELADGSELRIPHLSLLRRAVRVLGAEPRLGFEIVVNSMAAAAVALRVLEDAASRLGGDARVEFLRAHADGLVFRVTVGASALAARSALYASLVDALATAKLGLGRDGGRARPP